MAKMKIKPDAKRREDDVMHKLTALMLLHHLNNENKPKRKGAMSGIKLTKPAE